MRDALTNTPEASGVVTGAIFVVIVLAFRRGLWPALGRAGRLLRARGAAPLARPEGGARRATCRAKTSPKNFGTAQFAHGERVAKASAIVTLRCNGQITLPAEGRSWWSVVDGHVPTAGHALARTLELT